MGMKTEAFDRFDAALDEAKARGPVRKNIPPAIETRAAEILKDDSLAFCGVPWVWENQAEVTRDTYRLRAFVEHYRAQPDRPRQHLLPDGTPTRADVRYDTLAERAIRNAMAMVEASGGSPALTAALNFLSQACDCVADHVEGIQ